MDKNKAMDDVSFLIAIASIVCTVFNVFFLNGDVLPVFPNMLMLYAPLMALLNTLYLKRERSKKSIIIFNCIFILFSELIVYLSSQHPSLPFLLTALFLNGFFAFFSLKTVTGSSSGRSFVRVFDVTILVFLLSLIAVFSWGYSLPFTYAPAAGLAVSFFTVLIKKQSSNGKRKSWGSVLISLVLTFLMIFFFSRYAQQAGEGLVHLWEYIAFLFDRFMAFLDWLFSFLPTFFPKPSGNILPSIDDTYKKDALVVPVLSESIFEIILFTSLSIAALIVLVVFFRHLNLKKTVRKKNEKKKTIARPSFISGIKRAFLTLKEKIQLLFFIEKNKSNDLGLYLWLIRALRRDIWKKREDETPREFIERIESEARILLSLYTDGIEEMLYSPKKPSPREVENAYVIRKKVRKEVRKRRLLEVGEKVKSSLRRTPSLENQALSRE